MLQQEYKIDKYGKEILLQDGKHQVMMEWEKPYMEACIDKLQPKGDVLEIGFGMGYSATAIQKYKPKLAICVYHKESDFYSIPNKIFELNQKYQIFFRHYSYGFTESVIYFV